MAITKVLEIFVGEFEINKKTKDKNATTCKEYVAKKPLIRSCSREICLDGKIMKARFRFDGIKSNR